MKIALFTDTYLPDVNGVAISVDTLKRKMEDLGHEVHIITAGNKFFKSYEESPRIFKLGGVKLKKLYGYNLGRFYSIRGMMYLKRHNFDVFHIHSEFTVGGFARYAASRLKIPLVYTYHTTWEEYTHYVTKAKAAVKITKKASKVLANACTELIVPSEKTRNMLREYGVEKFINVVPTGLNLKRFMQGSADKDRISIIRDEYNLHGKFTLIFIGRIAAEKNIASLLKNVAKLMEIEDNVRMLIVGDGPSKIDDENVAKDLGISDKVTFVGKVPMEAVPYFYRASDLFVNASTSETQGLTYIESLATGLPVLAQNDPVLLDLIENGVNGYLFHDDEEFVRYAKSIIKRNHEERKQLILNAVSSVKKYDDQIFVKKVEEIYIRAIQRKKRHD